MLWGRGQCFIHVLEVFTNYGYEHTIRREPGP